MRASRPFSVRVCFVIMDSMTTAPTSSIPAPTATTDPHLRGAEHTRRIASTLARTTFCTIATVSEAGHPHSAGVICVWADGAMWIHTMRSSRKGRNIAHDSRVAVTVPYRKLPLGPPFTLHFQGCAALVPVDDAAMQPMLRAGALKLISGHGALDEPDGVFVRIAPTGTVHSYGLGAGTLDLVRDPLHRGAGSALAADDSE